MSKYDKLWRYGSVQILRDGRVRPSALTSPALCHLSFIASTHSFDLQRMSRVVLYLTLARGRIVTSCFAFDLTPDELRAVIAEIQELGHGLEQWIVPGLEYMSLGRTLKEDNPALLAAMPQILESCKNLPIAERWRRVRERYFRATKPHVRQPPVRARS